MTEKNKNESIENENKEELTLEEKIKFYEEKLANLEEKLNFLEEENLNLKKENLELKEKIAKDDLTGLLRRNFFQELVEKEINSLLREEEVEKRKEGFSTLSVLFLDIDNFKEINDNYGHKSGDEILKMVSDILKENLRDTDYIARWGGDEFVISLLGANENEAKKKAQSLNEIINKQIKEKMNLDINLSIGVAEHNEGIDFSDLIERADKSMYQAKTTGKNNVITYTEYEESLERLKENDKEQK